MHDPRRVLLLSTSTVHGSGFLEYCLPVIADHFAGRGRILFVPYASPGGLPHDDYTALVSGALAPLGLGIEGIHASSDPARAVREAEGIFIGGGNTFLLLREQALYPYFRIINALDRSDALFYSSEGDPSLEPRPVGSIPILPVLGIEWRL